MLANDIEDLGTIEISEKVRSKVLKDVSHEQIKNADIADALNKNVTSVSLVRRSGISNDIILRGQKKDNINVTIDNAKIYGACPNRMDPPISHVLSNNIENISILEGPYDVENFGTLSGKVSLKTKEPTKEISGEVNAGVGSFHTYKGSASVSGGVEHFKLLLSASKEQGDAYKDGDGDDFLAQQIKAGMPMGGRYLKDGYRAYEKKTFLAKGVANFTDDSLLRFSYTGNRSDQILYPNTPMDADYDDSNIYTIGYEVKNLGSFSKKLDIEYYYSDVDHPMSGKLRNFGKSSYKTNHLKTSMWGAKIKNSMEIEDTMITYGFDTSVRKWKGKMHETNTTTGEKELISETLSPTATDNKAIFLKIKRDFGNLNLFFGSRYDYTDIDVDNPAKTDRKYVGFNANLFAIYTLNEDFKLFGGFGKSSRVPDARELYYGSFDNDLDQTKNYEADAGFEANIGDFSIKTKLFYSKLKDYIYSINGTGFRNIDAHIYGINIDSSYFFTDSFYVDYSLNYQRGKKDTHIDGSDNLAEIPPLKNSLSVNYDTQTTKLQAQLIGVNKWKHYDDANGEQELGGYAILNLKASQTFFKSFTLTVGVDNLFDKTYKSTNTYKDIRYLESGGERIMLNDPGRYIYANVKYAF